jgi:hypothetical protein
MGSGEKLKPTIRKMYVARRIIDRAPERDYWDLHSTRLTDLTTPDPNVQDFAHFLSRFGNNAKQSV